MTAANKLWAGLDTSSRYFDICVIDDAGATVSEGRTPASLDALLTWLTPHSSTIAAIAVETGATSVDIVRKLRANGHSVALYNARHVHQFLRIRLNKTDTNDARGLAEVARLGADHLRLVHLKSIECTRIRSQLNIRERLIKSRRAQESGLMSLMHMYGVRAEGRVYSASSLRQQVEDMIVRAELDYGPSVRNEIEPILELCVTLRREVDRIDNELRSYALRQEVCSRFLKIPGVGVISSLSFFTAIEDPTRFHRVTDVGAFLGLTPRIWRTGNFSQTKGITKTGSAMTRKHLFSAAKAAMNTRKPNPLQCWGLQIATRSNRKKATVAVSRKLAVLMLAIWKSGSNYRVKGENAPSSQSHAQTPKLVEKQ